MAFGSERGITIGRVRASDLINHLVTLHHPVKAIVAQIINHRLLRFFVMGKIECTQNDGMARLNPESQFMRKTYDFMPENECLFANGSWSLNGTYFSIFQRRQRHVAGLTFQMHEIKLIIFKKTTSNMQKISIINFGTFADSKHLSNRVWIGDNILYVPCGGLLQKIEILGSDSIVITPANECVSISSLFTLCYANNLTLTPFDIRQSHIYRVTQIWPNISTLKAQPIYFKNFKGQIYVVALYMCPNPVHLHHIMTISNLQHLEWQQENPLNRAFMRRVEIPGLVSHIDFTDENIVILIGVSQNIHYINVDVQLAIGKPHDGFRIDCSLIPFFTSPFDADATPYPTLQIAMINMQDWVYRNNAFGNDNSIAHLLLDYELDPFDRKIPQTIFLNNHFLIITCMKDGMVVQCKAFFNYAPNVQTKELVEADTPWITENAKGSLQTMFSSNIFTFSLRSFTTACEKRELFDYNS
jgi:hypothetical protein